MIKLIVPPPRLNFYVKRHCERLLPLIRDRINQPANICLKDHFKSDQEILEILGSEPADLVPLHQKIINDLSTLHSSVLVWDTLENVFNEAEFFRKARPGYNAYTLVRSLKQPTCLYCNIHLTAPVYLADKISRPPIDHFFASSLYPGLSMSFYNLIPACTDCNTIKSNKPTSVASHVHPYINRFGDDCPITLTGYKSLDDVVGKKLKPFSVVFNNKSGDSKIDQNIQLFALTPTYQTHRTKAHWVMRAIDRHSKAAIDSALKLVPQAAAADYWDIFGVHYDADLHKREPFSKLTRDLVREFASDELKSLLRI